MHLVPGPASRLRFCSNLQPRLSPLQPGSGQPHPELPARERPVPLLHAEQGTSLLARKTHRLGVPRGPPQAGDQLSHPAATPRVFWVTWTPPPPPQTCVSLARLQLSLCARPGSPSFWNCLILSMSVRHPKHGKQSPQLCTLPWLCELPSGWRPLWAPTVCWPGSQRFQLP